MARVIDLSPPIHPGLGVFPGDTTYQREVLLDVDGADALTLSRVTTTLHLGAHADAPNHYRRGGEGIAARSLGPYLGRCQVVRVDVARGARVRPADVSAPIAAPRVLIATGSFPDPDAWNGDFSSLSPELITWLAEQGVVLVGIDTPSVDPQDSKDLPSHAALARHDLCVLEGLVLAGVAPGIYTLLALPLPLVDADASPVRAVLVDDGGAAFG